MAARFLENSWVPDPNDERKRRYLEPVKSVVSTRLFYLIKITENTTSIKLDLREPSVYTSAQNSSEWKILVNFMVPYKVHKRKHVILLCRLW